MTLHGGPSPSPFPQPATGPERLLAAAYKCTLVLLLGTKYLQLTTPIQRAAGCVAAVVFVVIETIWTTIAHEDPSTGDVFIRFWNGSFGHSSFAQFWVNVLFSPMLLFTFRSLVHNPMLRVLLFPLNVWWLEIVEGYLIMFLFGRNVAWEYRGRDAFFHGNIKIQYALPWMGLGLAVEVVFSRILLPVASILSGGNEHGTCTLLVAAAVLTLSYSPRMGISGLMKAFGGYVFES